MRARIAALVMALMLLCGAQARSLYVVQAAGVAALVDADGREVIPAGLVEALFELERDALYAAGRPGAYSLYDADGARLNDSVYEMLEAQGDVVLFRQDGKYGAMDLAGNTVIPPEWTQLTYAGEGRFLALQGDLYDDQPDEMISLSAAGERLDTGADTACGLCPFSDDRMAFMQSDGQYGYVDALGRQVIPPQWRYGGEFMNGVAVVSDGAGMGLIDPEGQIVVAPQYTWISRGDGMIVARSDDGWVDVYAPDGHALRYTSDMPCDEAEVCGACPVLKSADAARLFDTNGVCVLETARDALFYPGLAGQVIVSDGAWGEACQVLINPDGVAASGRYQRLLPLCGDAYAFLALTETRYEADAAGVPQTAWDYDSARFGLLGDDGTERLPAIYREILPAGDDRLVLVSDDAVMFADLQGHVLKQWPVNETAASSSGANA